MSYIAHRRELDNEQQTVFQHLQETAELCSEFASKINLENTGRVLGLLHDFGKYSQSFQNYIKSAQGLIDPDNVSYVDAKKHKGKIDHATAGAQYVYQVLRKYGPQGQGELCGQILAICLASHHSGLIDTLSADINKGNVFDKRIQKAEEKAYLKECTHNSDPDLIQKLDCLLKGNDKSPAPIVLKELFGVINSILKESKDKNSTITSFNLGFLTRFLFSCLIDADRLNSAEFVDTSRLNERLSRSKKPVWHVAIDRLETQLNALEARNPIDKIRQRISNECYQKALSPQGIYTFTAPTGAGKTYASLRYALHHAKTHGLDHVFYIIPFTSVIEQNAQVMRDALEREGDSHPWILEHHASLESEHQTWKNKIYSENWDAPIVLTTMVQFLESLFSGGTKNVRRLHQLANSVLIFDEIQTLPINCTHLFCNALNFLVNKAGSTAVLCSATQPLLNKLEFPDKGQLCLSGEFVKDVSLLFSDLKRVQVENKCTPQGWKLEEIAQLAIEQFNEKGNCLTIVNTKKWARDLYQACEGQVEKEALFHLSTNQCAAHRKKIFTIIRQRLKQDKPVMCFSTQLIEAGVDLDFKTVIRFLAGLDSIAQAAGRCNRNGKQHCQTVFVVNPSDEKTDLLVDIAKGKTVAQRVMNEGFNDLMNPDAMNRYFDYYFFQRTEAMDYPCKDSQKTSTSLLKLLSNNRSHPCAENHRPENRKKVPRLEQSFMEAGKIFKAIDAPTKALIVPYVDEDAVYDDKNSSSYDVINILCSKDKLFDAALYFEAIKQAQKYSINVFPNVWETLIEAQAIQETQPGSEIYYLHKQYYDDAFGLSLESTSTADFYCC